MRGYPKQHRRSPSRRFRVPRTYHELVLRKNGFLHGASFVRSAYLFPILDLPLTHLQLTVVGMKHQDERVALQAVEFWSTVCEEEVELALEAQEVSLTSNH